MAVSAASATASGRSGWVGTIEAFVPGEEGDFEIYLKRMEHYFKLNKVTTDEEKVSALITLAGEYCVKKLLGAVHPDAIESKTYKECTDILKTKLAPKNNVVAERFKFFERRQHEEESISEFVSEIQTLARKCNFQEYKKEALRDRIICGVRSTRIRQRLLDEAKPLDETLNIALSMELAEENIKMMNPRQVGKMHGSKIGAKRSHSGSRSDKRENNRQKRSGSPIRCFRCGKWTDHIAVNCPERKKSFNQKFNRTDERDKGKQRKKQLNAVVDTESDISSNDDEDDRMSYRLHTMKLAVLKKSSFASEKDNEVNGVEEEVVERESDCESVRDGETVSMVPHSPEREDPVIIKVGIGKCTLRMEVDSGACVSVIHVKQYRDYLREFTLRNCEMNLRVVTGESVEILGKITVPVSIKNEGEWKEMGKLDLVVVNSDIIIPLRRSQTNLR
ncbi:uncharacterized protein LOC129790681 isoform X2 [Lutzomyia longipalpis]|uniref:uncharacterized protein LOC129790681 isoform X2 n=1 Tax=Lutzomyia longipalpis TaxID=7200 RepID=UPI0024840592|nr:uncharacterized protein LOC129790681 isoform X2 [Lutzomyia longipalpis]